MSDAEPDVVPSALFGSLAASLGAIFVAISLETAGVVTHAQVQMAGAAVGVVLGTGVLLFGLRLLYGAVLEVLSS